VFYQPDENRFSEKLHVCLCAGVKISAELCQHIKPCKIDISSVHDIISTGFRDKFIENIDIMRFAYLDLRGEEASQAADAAGLQEIVVWEEEE
jgi:hypothetical protein